MGQAVPHAAGRIEEVKSGGQRRLWPEPGRLRGNRNYDRIGSGAMIRLFVIISCLFFPVAANACSCADAGPICARLPDLNRPNTAIFVGRVTQVYPFKGGVHDYMRGLYSDPLQVQPFDREQLRTRLLRIWGESLTQAETERLRGAQDLSTLPRLFDGIPGVHVRRVRLNVIEGFTSLSLGAFELFTGIGGGDCGFSFEEGSEYLVFASKDPVSGRWSAYACGGTLSIGYASHELAALRSWKNGRALAPHIYGRVVDVTERHSEATEAQSRPMAGAKVTLRHIDGREMEISTDRDGNFLFSGLDRDQYTIALSLPGWDTRFVSGPHPNIDLSKQVCGDLDVYLAQQQGTVIGRLLPQPGERLPNRQRVDAIPVGTESGLVPKPGYADAEGHFRITNLEPGEYVLAVNAVEAPVAGNDRGISGEATSRYIPSYFPGVSDSTGADRFRVERGKGTLLPDWRLPRSAKTRMIQGRILWPDGSPAANIRVRIVMPSGGALVARLKTVGNGGSFSFAGLVGLSYKIQAAAWRGVDEYFWGEARIPADAAEHTVLRLVPDGRKARDSEFFGSRW